MKQNLKRNKLLNRRTLVALSLLVVMVVACAVLLAKQASTSDAASAPKTDSKLAQRTPGNPQFSFDAAQAIGWHQGPTDKVSMAAFGANSCFISLQHKTDTVDVEAELKKDKGMLMSMGYTSAERATVPMMLKTDAGPMQYQLYQYSASGAPGGRAIKGGQELGYVQLDDGYVKVGGYCDTAVQLSTTISALRSISFNATKK